jgi:hypothetical protein
MSRQSAFLATEPLLLLATERRPFIIDVDGLDVRTSRGGVCRHRGPGPLPPPLLHLRDLGRGLGGGYLPRGLSRACVDGEFPSA